MSARDSGKPLLDAIVGEVVVTCEKIHWLCKEGERYLRPEHRSSGIMVRARSMLVGIRVLSVCGMYGAAVQCRVRQSGGKADKRPAAAVYRHQSERRAAPRHSLGGVTGGGDRALPGA